MRDAREVWLQLSGTDIKLIEQFDYFQRTRGKIFPSQKWLAEKLRVSERTIRRSVAHLKSLGVILVQSRRVRDRRGQIHNHSNAYHLLGLAGAFLRGLLSRLTGRPKTDAGTARRKRIELPESFSEEKRELRPELLAKIPILGTWLERGKG